jgi:hypothetical protein
MSEVMQSDPSQLVTPSMGDGGPYAAVQLMNSMGFTLIDRPRDYSFYKDSENSVNKNILKNKNIVPPELKDLENKKVPVSEYFTDDEDSIFSPDVEQRKRKRKKNNNANDPNKYIKVDLTEFAYQLWSISSPVANSGRVFDSDWRNPDNTILTDYVSIEPNVREY